MTTVISSRAAAAALAATLALTAAGCGPKTTDRAASTAGPASGCPSAPAAAGAAADWTLPGATGSVTITVGDTAAPKVTVEAPLRVTETRIETLVGGDGPVVGQTDSVSVCYLGVNGRDGSVFDSSYQRGEPAEFSLDGVVPGFRKAIAGQKVGSTVAVAMVPADGYPQGQPRAGIRPGDTLVFAIKILDAQS